MLRRLSLLLASLPCLLAEPCEDSPALTTIWESTSTGNSDRLIDALIQNRDFAKHRSGDCRGPLFWAFEFKNVDALALYMHFGIALDQADNDGKSPNEFFDGSEDDLQGAYARPRRSGRPQPTRAAPPARLQSSSARPNRRWRSSPRCWPSGRRSFIRSRAMGCGCRPPPAPPAPASPP